jgi:pseudaminic acid cytidylyltransferase
MILAIIPARIGSKRLKKKNIKIFNGKPLIYYSINEAKKTRLFDKIIVSTDSKKIADLAMKYGANIPLLRPKSLSDDFTSTQDVIKYCISIEKKNNKNLDYVCCIYPTAPLIKYKNIIKGLKILKKNKYDFVFSASKFQSSVQRSFFFNNGKLKKLFSKYENIRSQYLREHYYDAGQFYWGPTNSWIKKKIFSSNSNIVEIPVLEAFDLNTKEDWKNLIKLKSIK